MQLEIVTPDENLYQGDIVSAIFPGLDGSFGVLENHAPIISPLEKGVIEVIENDKTRKTFEVKAGIVEVNNNKIIVLAEN